MKNSDQSRLSRRRLAQSLAGVAGARLAAGGSARAAAPDPAKPWHDPAGGFRNPNGSVRRGGASGDWWSFFYRRVLNRGPAPVPPPGHRLDDATIRANLDQLMAGDGIMWLGHASFLIRLEGRTILTDPYLTDYASPVPPFGPRRYTPPALRPRQLPPIDLLLLSHNHYDHLDLPTLGMMPVEGCTVVTPLGVTRYLDAARFPRRFELDWHERTAVGRIGVTAMPALHFSKRNLWDAKQTLWAGFRIEPDGGAPGRTIHFIGDTAYGPVFAEAGQRYPAPDLALVPIGAYEPRALMQAAHCNPEEAVQIGRELGARRLAGMHWGTIMLTDEPPFEPPVRFQTAAAAAGYAPEDVWVMAVGEVRPL